MSIRKTNALAYRTALEQIPVEHADTIRVYVATVNKEQARRRVEAKDQQTMNLTKHHNYRPEFARALHATTQAAKDGVPLNDLTTIAKKHSLTAREHEILGSLLWQSSRLGLLKNNTE